ncbi:MAG: hypothetical protein OHK0013_42510 [Sandaracinaceae bacterium]
MTRARWRRRGATTRAHADELVERALRGHDAGPAGGGGGCNRDAAMPCTIQEYVDGSGDMDWGSDELF